MSLNNMRVSTKLWLTTLGLMLLLLVTVAVTYASVLHSMTKSMDKSRQASERVATAERWRGVAQVASTVASSMATAESDAQAASYMAQLKEAQGRSSQAQKRLGDIATSPDDQAAFAAISAEREKVLKISARIGELKKAGDAAGVKTLRENEHLPAIALYLGTIDKFVDLQHRQQDEADAEAMGKLKTQTTMGVVVVLVVLALGVFIVRLFTRSITQPLAQAVSAAGTIANGDLTKSIQVDRSDEFGALLKALADMNSKLRNVVGEVRSGVESVASAANEIASGNADLSARTEQTAANLEEAAASMEQLTSTVTQSADTAHQANQLASKAAQAARNGGSVVQQVVGSMQQISDSSRKISDIIGVIDGIAFQTNILALNAAVEAARAGEQGRGFAVVAGEVRALAGRSAEAAKEIKALIAASVQNVDMGTAQVAQAGQSMEEIVSSVQRVSDLIGEIAAATSEQKDGIGQVKAAVMNLDQMTQQNAALVEESSAAATGMRDQTHRLASVVSVFHVGTDTTSALAASGVAARPVDASRPVRSPDQAQAAHSLAARKSLQSQVPARKPVAAAPARQLAVPAQPQPPRTAVSSSTKVASDSAKDDWEMF
jgi:methyl-accepting chemotaxis protein